MKVLVIGSGGREHALAWKAAQSAQVTEVFVAPGNAGTATEPKLTNVNLDIADNAALVAFAKDNAIELTIVGPEQPLVDGVVDAFTAEGLLIFGPNAKAASLKALSRLPKTSSLATIFQQLITKTLLKSNLL